MAIDMIESSEMSALAGSRLGMKNFADDDWQYKNAFGSQIRDYANRATETLKKKLSSDCDKIDQSLAIIQADIDANIKASATQRGDSAKKTKMAIQKAQVLLGEYEKMKITNCAKISEAQKVADEAKFQETLTKITEGAVQQAKKDVGGTTITEKIQNNKPLVIGGAIIVIGVVAYLMFKKN